MVEYEFLSHKSNITTNDILSQIFLQKLMQNLKRFTKIRKWSQKEITVLIELNGFLLNENIMNS